MLNRGKDCIIMLNMAFIYFIAGFLRFCSRFLGI